MLPENLTAIVARNETWTGLAATEPYEAGWAREAIVFVRALKAPKGPLPTARIEISADGMHWVAEGSRIRAARSGERRHLPARRAFRRLPARRRRAAGGRRNHRAGQSASQGLSRACGPAECVFGGPAVLTLSREQVSYRRRTDRPSRCT